VVLSKAFLVQLSVAGSGLFSICSVFNEGMGKKNILQKYDSLAFYFIFLDKRTFARIKGN